MIHLFLMSIDTAPPPPRKTISRLFAHENKIKNIDWDHAYMAEVSKFSKELFIRGQHVLVLAGFEKNETLEKIAKLFEKIWSPVALLQSNKK